MPPNDARIAFWGPSASGKSWLVDAFQQQLDLLDYEDEDFSYTIEHSNIEDGEIKLPREPPKPGATKGLEDHDLLITRKPKKTFRRAGKGAVNTHTHRLQLRDIQGSWAWNLDPGDDTTRTHFANATGVIIALDHMLIADARGSRGPAENITTSRSSPVQDDTDYILKDQDHTTTSGGDEEIPPTVPSTVPAPFGEGAYTKRQWTEKVGAVANLLKRTGKKYRIAVCVTKIDQCQTPHREASEVIEGLYGRNMHILLDEIRRHFPVKEFCVSSAGYLSDGKDTPNFDPNREVQQGQRGYLRDEDNWRPYNVLAPFFWMFEDQERQRLKSEGNWLARQLFAERRLNMHEPYPETYR